MTEQEVFDRLSDCMEQKRVLLTRVSDITKEIEVQSRQKEIDTNEIGSLAGKRQVYIDRLKKCQQFLADSCEKLPEDRRERMEKILAGTFPEEECAAEESRLAACGANCRALLQKALAADTQARGLLQNECDRLQERMQAARKTSRKTQRQTKKP